MPEIARFYGIIIKIFFTREHNPPHFRAVYGEYNGTFEISTLNMIEGDLQMQVSFFVTESEKA